jgi:hypothetical protein
MAAQKMRFLFHENGDVMTWGEEMPDGVELTLPADWYVHGSGKYVYNGTDLVVRDGWVDPVAQEEPGA